MPVWNPVSRNMRLNSSDKVRLEVMSDCSLLPKVSSSSATHSNIVNNSPPAVSQTVNDINSLSLQKESMGVQLSSSLDLEADDSSPQRLSSTSVTELIIDQSLQQQNLSSFDSSAYDEESLDATKKDNAKSAFEITSVRPATDDHERSVLRNPVSTDSLRDTLQGELSNKTGAGESNDSMVVPPNDKQQDQPPSDVQEGAVQALFVIGSPQESENRPAVVQDETTTPSTTKVGNKAAKIPISSEDSVVSAYPSNASSSTVGTVVGGGAAAGNGTSVQPNRFRRVNQYERGRWTVRDSLVTEEQGETTASSTLTIVHSANQQSKHLVASNSQQQPEAAAVGEPLGNGTPPRSVHQRVDQPLPTTATATATATTTATSTSDPLQMATDPGNLPGNLGGLGGGSDLASDRDSSSVHMDKNSTAADTLSRNTSMSSIVPEKSIDGEELHDSEGDSISGGGGGSVTGGGGGGGSAAGGGGGTHGYNQDQELSEVSVSSSGLTNPPVVSIASVGAVAPSLQTAIPRHQEPSFTSGSSCSDIRKDSE